LHQLLLLLLQGQKDQLHPRHQLLMMVAALLLLPPLLLLPGEQVLPSPAGTVVTGAKIRRAKERSSSRIAQKTNSDVLQLSL
jgi:hypothetical protein